MVLLRCLSLALAFLPLLVCADDQDLSTVTSFVATVTSTTVTTAVASLSSSNPNHTLIPTQFYNEIFSQQTPNHLNLVFLYCKHLLSINSLEPSTISWSKFSRIRRRGDHNSIFDPSFLNDVDVDLDDKREDLDDNQDIDENEDDKELYDLKNYNRIPELHKSSKNGKPKSNHDYYYDIIDTIDTLYHKLSNYIHNLIFSSKFYNYDNVQHLHDDLDNEEEEEEEEEDTIILNSTYYNINQNEDYQSKIIKANKYFNHIQKLDIRPRPNKVPKYMDYYHNKDFNLTLNDLEFIKNPLIHFPNFHNLNNNKSLIKTKCIRILRFLAKNYQMENSIELLGDIFLYGLYYQKRDFRKSFRYYSILSKLGSPIGHRKLGLLYALGFGTKRNYSKAVLYFGFATASSTGNSLIGNYNNNDINLNNNLGIDITSLQILGYYHKYGIGTKQNCIDASYFYKKAGKLINEEFINNGPPLGKTIPNPKEKIYDLTGGLYGFGSSGVGDPKLNKDEFSRLASKNTDAKDVLSFYKVQADAGDIIAQALVGQLYYMGTRNIERDYIQARRYFKKSLKEININQFIIDGKIEVELLNNQNKRLLAVASQSTGYLGLIYFRGEGVKKNDFIAKNYFEQGIALENILSFLGLGLMYMDGLGGMKQDVSKGLMYIQYAAEHGNGDAQYIIGLHYLKKGMNQVALKYLKSSSSKLNISAMYILSTELLLNNSTLENYCELGINNLKDLIEKADWHDDNLLLGQKYYMQGDYEKSFIYYMISSELGYELGQSNAAYLIDSGLLKESWSNNQKLKIIKNDNINNINKDIKDLNLWEYALSLWHRSWQQGNVDAGNKIGDYYFYGIGNYNYENNKGNNEIDYNRSAIYYLLTRNKNSGIGMWNLGYMYEYGLGVEKDLIMAKTLYIESMKTNPQSYLPCIISIINVNIKQYLEFFLNYQDYPKMKLNMKLNFNINSVINLKNIKDYYQIYIMIIFIMIFNINMILYVINIKKLKHLKQLLDHQLFLYNNHLS